MVGAVGGAYSLVLLLSVASLLAAPRFSLRIAVPGAGPSRIVWVLPGGSLWDDGARPGDRVLLLDRRPPQRRDDGMWSGTRIRVRTAAGAALVADARMLPNGRDTWPLLLLSPWFLLLGTLVYLRARDPAVGRLTYLLFASAALALALTPATYSDQPIAAAFEFALVLAFAACFVLFFLTFPAPRGGRRVRIAVLLPPLLLSPCGLIMLLWPPMYDVAAPLRLTLLLLSLLIGVGLLVHASLSLREDGARRGLQVIGAGTAASVAPFVLLYLAPTLLGRSPLLPPEIAILALALMPVSFAHAILRHDVLHVQLLQRWFVHGILWAALIAGYMAAASILRAMLDAALPEPARGPAFIAALVALIAGSFRRLHDAPWRRIDQHLFKDRYDYGASLHALSRDLSLAADPASLGSALSDRLCRLMNLDFIVLLGQGQGAPSVHGVADAYEVDLLPALVQAAAISDNPRMVPVGRGALDVLLVPLRTHGELVGHLCLGPKRSGEPFRTSDTALLSTLSGHLAAMVRNAHLVDDLRAKVAALDALNERLQRVQEEERACLMADIHDEPLQTAIHLHRQLASAERADRAHHEHVTLSRALMDQLRAACSSIRPSVLDDLGLPAALDRLTRDLGGRAGVPIVLEVEPELDEVALPHALDLMLYRATQEALNNCLRHAQPTLIRVELRRNGGRLRLLIADDGVGFVAPGSADGPNTTGHLGLIGLRTRVQRVGGHLSIDSAPGAGTRLWVDVPLPVVSR